MSSTALSTKSADPLQTPIQTSISMSPACVSISQRKQQAPLRSSALITSGCRWWWCTEFPPVPAPGSPGTRGAARRRQSLPAPLSCPQSTSGWSPSPADTCWASQTESPSARSRPAEALWWWGRPHGATRRWGRREVEVGSGCHQPAEARFKNEDHSTRAQHLHQWCAELHLCHSCCLLNNHAPFCFVLQLMMQIFPPSFFLPLSPTEMWKS